MINSYYDNIILCASTDNFIDSLWLFLSINRNTHFIINYFPFILPLYDLYKIILLISAIVTFSWHSYYSFSYLVILVYLFQIVYLGGYTRK